MSNDRPAPRAGIMEIDAYVPGKNPSQRGGPVYKLSSNETPLGPSAAARNAFLAAASSLELYPDGSAHSLRESIAQRFGIDQRRIVCGNGSDDLLHLLAAAYVGPGDEGILTAHGFQIFQIAIQAAGGRPIYAREHNLTASVDEILSCVTQRTKIVFLANPNNPTGTYLPAAEIVRLADFLPSRVLLVLDGAYAEYVTADDYVSGLELVHERQNVVITRTFSKIHGLASLRVGWAFAPEHICEVLHRIRGPFNVSSPAIAAAVAAIGDELHVLSSIDHTQKWRNWLTSGLQDIGLKVTPSVANFILVQFPDAIGDDAQRAEMFLSQRGILVRGVASYRIRNALRITIGEQAANEAVLAALKEFMAHN